jgi:hypothetical protein
MVYTFYMRLSALIAALAIAAACSDYSSPDGIVHVDVKANGQDGPVTLTGAAYTYTWTSQNATGCQQTMPTTGGVALIGTSAAINAGDALYPAVGAGITIKISCTDGYSSDSDSVRVQR